MRTPPSKSGGDHSSEVCIKTWRVKCEILLLFSWSADHWTTKNKWAVIHFRKDVIDKYVLSMTNNQIHLYLMNGWQQIPNSDSNFDCKRFFAKQASACSIDVPVQMNAGFTGVLDASAFVFRESVLVDILPVLTSFAYFHCTTWHEDRRKHPNSVTWSTDWIRLVNLKSTEKHFSFRQIKIHASEISKVLTIK